eukprot:3864206-Prymnesium_polylepis.1
MAGAARVGRGRRDHGAAAVSTARVVPALPHARPRLDRPVVAGTPSPLLNTCPPSPKLIARPLVAPDCLA